MARMQISPEQLAKVKQTLDVSAPTGPKATMRQAAQGAKQGTANEKPINAVLGEVVVRGEKEKPLTTVGTGTHSASISLYPSMVKEYVDSVNPKWAKFIDTTSAETMKKSLSNLSNLSDFATEIDKKYFNKSGNLGEIKKQALIDIFKRNPDFNF